LNDNDLDEDEDEGYINDFDDSDEEEKDTKAKIKENKENSNEDLTKKAEISPLNNKNNEKDVKSAEIEMRNKNSENNSISTNDNLKSQIKTNVIGSVEEDPDSSQVCHRIIHKVIKIIFFLFNLKGCEINLSDFNMVKFKKFKIKSGILSYIGFSKNKVERNYLCFFDEYFIYFLKDIIINKHDSNLRKIGNKYELRLINNISLNVRFINY